LNITEKLVDTSNGILYSNLIPEYIASDNTTFYYIQYTVDNNGDIQRKKFSLLTELFLKLCKNRNYQGNFKNISSLILLFLSMYKKNYPVDIFFKKKFGTLETKGDALAIKRILKQELRKTSPTL